MWESVGQELQLQGLNTKEWRGRLGALPDTVIRPRAKRLESFLVAPGIGWGLYQPGLGQSLRINATVLPEAVVAG